MHILIVQAFKGLLENCSKALFINLITFLSATVTSAEIP